ncbi:putative POL2-DNA polymerase epsilon, calytic subunit A [Jaminaea rosea]|uniref:DNA polymerase epsilon catalytic subunit n=1 Tax=Jaminaea rosea TaxID=1569628 RepID=A0A316UXD5_9BASI|nr:putative POL2-DNA polymerase epsilon, calytic subunit A [Jaminaea rosea]PWN28583.1 putative POL2-DNA polymerase epsilon, calytic subunit A [Jaminaea rosea]
MPSRSNSRNGAGGGRTFGLTSSGSNTRMSRGTFRRRGGGGGSTRGGANGAGPSRSGGSSAGPSYNREAVAAAGASLMKGIQDGTSAEDRFKETAMRDEIDAKMGSERMEVGPPREAWLVNMHPTLLPPNPADDGGGHATGKAAVDFYFIEDDASSFKVTVQYCPYVLLGCKPGTESIVEEWLKRKFEGLIINIERQRKEDLKLPNHLVGNDRLLLKLNFWNVQDLLSVRREVLPLAQAFQRRRDAVDTYADTLADAGEGGSSGPKLEPEECIADFREYDIPYYLRVAIDNDIRVGLWYSITFDAGHITLQGVPSRVKRAEPTVLAFDIETTKQPLKFPDAETDVIMMISYMIDGQGFLITNREVVSEDIDDFEYSPKEEYEGPFIIFNEADEFSLLRRFFEHFREAKPTVVATYNGDSFDFPFVDARASFHGLSMLDEIGFSKDNEGEYKARTTAHMDCFRWVKRDSYLPQGSQGLKAVTVAKLGYDPMELDPELMTPYAMEQPQTLAQYSVSDAVATYYLYMKYVHPFIFSLCNIIPLNPDEVLRKGSGTLCETLLMVQAYKGNIVMPNRHTDPVGSTYEGHLLESETYVGGHVEALEAGVFRSDIATDFKLDPAAFQQLIDDLDAALQFSIREEGKWDLDDVANYDEVKQKIKSMLEALRDQPLCKDEPLIYHLDVAAMYPNIMLSNRLQPDSVVDEAMCATCEYNRPSMKCNKKMTWAWRGEYFPAKRDEVNMIRHALTGETFPPRWPNGPRRTYHDLGEEEKTALLHKRLGDYSRKVYRKNKETKTVYREATICQRENPFYIDTVRDFRDRRYEYKGLHKTWKKNLDSAQNSGGLTEVVEAKKMIVLYDSLQLAHKCILNSFYGYVMRKGARWYSMEMAGITCLTGATIIQMAKELVDRIGRPLELDTDGIWCMLPGKFPENFSFKSKSTGKKFGISYPCTMLNHLVHARFTNHQYHTLADKETGRYEVHSENSIFFELDGPYRAMILPSSKEEDKLLKKRYAVFEHDGSLAELKGFEVKRRGELQLIKDFQKQIFEKFLLGDTLVECYAAVATVANQWLDILYNKGATLHDEELVDLIAENKSMSKMLSEYGSQKSTAITTAKRLAEFLGAQMVKDKGLACKFIISAKPFGAPVTERAVPVAIFNAEESVKQHYLRKFLRDGSLTDFDLRSILDWDYYIERFGSVIQKLITIPAAMQRVPNPVPRVRHPDWLFKRVAARENRFKQRTLADAFKNTKPMDPEEVEKQAALAKAKAAALVKSKEPVPEVPLPPVPSFEVDYAGYVAAMKPRWKAARALRKAANAASGTARSLGAPSTRGGLMTSHLSRGLSSIATATWDVVQITPATRAGEYRLWIAIGGQLQSLRLRIPRQFYLSLRSEPKPGMFQEGYIVEKVSKALPRGATCRNFYRLTVAEDVFIEEEAHFSSLLNHPIVEGIYERHVPLDVRALIKFGSTCALDSRSRKKVSRALDVGFDLDDLVKSTHSPISKQVYLNGGAGIRYFYLYHAQLDGRHVLGLFSPEGQLKLHIVDSAGLRQVPNLTSMYGDRVSSLKARGKINDGDGVFEYVDALDVDFKVHTTEQRAFRALARDLTQLRTAKQGSAMLAICSSKSQDYYELNVGSALVEFPILSIPASNAEDELPALGWQLYSSRRMLSSFFRASGWIKRWIEIAAYFDLPLCNLERDFAVFGADVDFARRLAAQDHVLWWSSSPAPDLGGREQDNHTAGQPIEEVENVEISKPGCYTNVVFEVALRDLAINSVLQSAAVNDMEGSSSSGGSLAFDNASHNLDEYAKGTVASSATFGDAVLTSQVFSSLKIMVKSWYVAKARNKSTYSSLLADNFWRWASSNRSAMFEPAMQKFLHGLMRKTLLQLLGEFKRLGSTIVYASVNRLFLLTNKPTAGSAAAYGRYLVSTVTSRDLFRHLGLDIVHFWEQLTWMDVANFGGVISADPEAEEPSETFTVEMNWNVQRFLPLAVQPRFASVVGGFIFHVYENKRKSQRASGIDRTPLRPVTMGANGEVVAQQGKEEDDGEEAAELSMIKGLSGAAEVKFLRDFIQRQVTRKLLKVTTDIRAEHQAAVAAASGQSQSHRQRYDDLDEDEEEQDPASVLESQWSFPDLPGKVVPPPKVARAQTPALEFVKSTMAVLSLAPEVAQEVTVLRRNLLQLLGVGAFSREAEWRPPCEPFRLPLVICTYCCEERTLDLCRDEDLLSSSSTGEKPVWRCSACTNALPRAAIESRLVSIAHSYVATFALQDLRCSKCSATRETDAQVCCGVCAGPWSWTVSRVETVRKLRNLAGIAAWHRLETLAVAVEALLAAV